MEPFFVLILVGLSSAGARLLGRRGLPRGGFRFALGKALECLGLAVLFFAANVSLGFLISLLARASGQVFVSVYLSVDIALLALSLVQALVFQWWRETAR